MARLLGGGGCWRSCFHQVLAVQGCLDTIRQARRENRRPLRNRLRVDANSFCSFGYRATKQRDSFVFSHAQMLVLLQSICKHSNIHNL